MFFRLRRLRIDTHQFIVSAAQPDLLGVLQRQKAVPALDALD